MNNYIPMIEEKAEGQVAPVQMENTPTETAQAHHDQPTIPQAGTTGQMVWTQTSEISELRSRWNAIQAEFVDQPRTSVSQAHELVTEILARIEKSFTNSSTVLNEQWANQEDISTENLRIVLQNYRMFVNRLLTL